MSAKYLYGRRVELWLETKNETYKFYYHQTVTHAFGITFTVPFSDSTTAQTCNAAIMNLSRSHQKEFKKGCKVKLFAGYAESGVGLLTQGFITGTPAIASDGTNSTFSFTFKEGVDANTKKKVNMSFAPGTRVSTVIRRVAKKAGITLGKVKLAKPKAACKSGYTASGNPVTTIKKLAKLGGSRAYRCRGVLTIDDLSKADGHNEHLYLTMKQPGKHGGTGLIAYPTYNQDDDSKPTVEIQTLLFHQINVGSLIQVDNSYFSGTKRVQSGQHVCDDSSFTTTSEVYA